MNYAPNNPSPTTTQYERKLATDHEHIKAAKMVHRHDTQGMFYVRCKYGKLFVACLEDGRPKAHALRSEDINTALIFPVCIHDAATDRPVVSR